MVPFCGLLSLTCSCLEISLSMLLFSLLCKHGTSAELHLIHHLSQLLCSGWSSLVMILLLTHQLAT
eukprot:Seg1487.12 transcript_id=Seg1487.12/GoldUCD/mRNA.D3Y31 product="hypothetical protein" pseudo=true protein_id=Seg1487.12/GoldUCD/D3Y31